MKYTITLNNNVLTLFYLDDITGGTLPEQITSWRCRVESNQIPNSFSDYLDIITYLQNTRERNEILKIYPSDLGLEGSEIPDGVYTFYLELNGSMKEISIVIYNNIYII